MKHYLFAPGPTPVPERVLQRMAQPIIHHRTPQFSAIFAETREMLGQIFQTRQQPLMLTSSGTGAMEAAITNLCSPGDTIIFVNGGKFGERWGKIAIRHGVEAVEIPVVWGEPVAVDAVAAALAEHPDAKGVFVQASETSTTTEHPIQQIAALTKDMAGCVTVVDAITALGVIDMPMDAWGLDVVISGSQKAFMLPPGLAMIACSEKYWELSQSASCKGFYFDLAMERKSQGAGKDTTAWTPAIALVIGLHEVLQMMLEEGLPALYARHQLLAQATRAGVGALGMKLVSSAPSAAATGAFVPPGVDGLALFGYLRDVMGVTFAGGQDDLKGRILRIAHLGYSDLFDVITALSAIEIALERAGAVVQLGAGVAAAQAVLVNRFPKA